MTKFIIDMYDKETFAGSPTIWTTEKDFYTYINKYPQTKRIWEY